MIVGLNVLTESAVVELQNELTVEVSPDEVQAIPSSKEPAKSSRQRTQKTRSALIGKV